MKPTLFKKLNIMLYVSEDASQNVSKTLLEDLILAYSNRTLGPYRCELGGPGRKSVDRRPLIFSRRAENTEFKSINKIKYFVNLFLLGTSLLLN